MERKQKFLKVKGLIVLIAVMNMIVPLSLDMYLPAVPQMTQVFDTDESVVNVTLVGFFFFMAVGILLFGPLSDKWGRKPMLLLGTGVYAVFSAACALAPTIGFLIGARIAQALGAGCMMAVSTALIKDSFERKTRDVVLAVVQAMSVIAPMLAPIVGAWVVTVSGWRMTFWVLVIMAILCFGAVLLLQETVSPEERNAGSVLGSLGGLYKVGRNGGFSLFLMTVGVLSAPYMAYISVCSYIYIDFFLVVGDYLQLFLRRQFRSGHSGSGGISQAQCQIGQQEFHEYRRIAFVGVRAAPHLFRQYGAPGVPSVLPALHHRRECGQTFQYGYPA